MGELTQSMHQEESAVAQLSHRRLLIDMVVVTVAGFLVLLVAGYVGFAFGFVVGSLLSFANYFWLKNSIRKLFERAIDGTSPALLAMVYFFRYVLLAAVLYLIYVTNALPVVAVVVGLGCFVFAVMIEGFYNIFSTFNKKEF
jgi:hypothetical protein